MSIVIGGGSTLALLASILLGLLLLVMSIIISMRTKRIDPSLYDGSTQDLGICYGFFVTQIVSCHTSKTRVIDDTTISLGKVNACQELPQP